MGLVFVDAMGRCRKPVGRRRPVVIPALPDLHARYPEIALEIGFAERMIDRVCEEVRGLCGAGR
ncbi:hypothetical protein [Azotobacter salinestris]|uniref:hypothetical protein n=1 Tax=Azotobacter salinestris TaxID=69964 RepID=UPI001AD6FCD3|nr:hypothetical protein [Azotobacter salinestris]